MQMAQSCGFFFFFDLLSRQTLGIMSGDHDDSLIVTSCARAAGGNAPAAWAAAMLGIH